MNDSAASTESPLEQFLRRFEQSVAMQALVALTLSSPVKGAEIAARQQLRPIELRGEQLLQWTLTTGTQQRHENCSFDESRRRLQSLLETSYRQAALLTTDGDWHFKRAKRRDFLRREQRQRTAAVATHDREKQYLIPQGTPVGFLVDLGVMTSSGQVKADKFRKFRQINRYLEFVNDVAIHLPQQGQVCVTDFGCGLSYLTFALHHLLHGIQKREVDILGLDRNADVINRANQTVQRLELTGLRFECTELAAYPDPLELNELADRSLHLAVSLHACDTATDATLLHAVQARANVILAVPCCQHQVAPQLNAAELSSVLGHGLFRERLGSLLTDALRATALEAAGYQAQVLEFIDLEHTPKNVLLRAVRRDVDPLGDDRCRQARREYAQLREFLGIETLATDSLLS
ncbi:MAG: SAM-dependent methyltransferase [Planctomycetaceae bacterium]|nr:SAM-dependent methyltransferase [Planctomycetaceae bacterium]